MKRKVLFIGFFLYVQIFCFLGQVNAGNKSQEKVSDTLAVSCTPFGKGICRIADFGRPFWADMESALIRGEIAIASNLGEYDFGKRNGRYTPYVFANLGVDLPLWTGFFAGRKFGLAVTMPFSVNIWLDLFDPVTAPVVNTDYHIGLPEVCFIQRFTDKGFLKNYTLKLSPVKHESTHIGDELTIYREDENLPLTRVNVSYNTVAFVFTLNDSDGTPLSNHAFRFGFNLLYYIKNGWYSIRPEEGDESKLKPNKTPYEFYVQYQYQTQCTKVGLQGIVSAEIRNRARYNYPYYDKDASGNWVEYAPSGQRAWTFNVFAGLRYNANVKRSYFSKIGVGVRGYYGINPNGQFRSQTDYKQVGLALIFE